MEYLSKEQLEKLTKEELECLLEQNRNLKNELNTTQKSYKTVINSAYGVLAVPYSRYFNLPIAEAIPAVGRESIKSGVRYINDLMNHPNQDMLNIFSEINDHEVELKKEKIVDSVVYCDTDSVVGDSLIYVNEEKLTIEEFYNNQKEYIQNDDINKKYVKKVNNKKTYTYDGSLVEKPIKYVMKHKVKKHMYKITINDKSVTITEDHSIMVEKGGKLLSIKIKELQKGDIFICIDKKSTNCIIKDLGEQEIDVYDIEVEDTHSFFANDILVHNSAYVSFDIYIGNYIDRDKWEALTDDKKIEYVEKLATIVEDDLNKRTFNETQMVEYNSTETDFKITYKQEKIAKSGL
jgi:hypothetical protein